MKRSKKFSKKRKFSTRKLLPEDLFSIINAFEPNRSIPV